MGTAEASLARILPLFGQILAWVAILTSLVLIQTLDFGKFSGIIVFGALLGFRIIVYLDQDVSGYSGEAFIWLLRPGK